MVCVDHSFECYANLCYFRANKLQTHNVWCGMGSTCYELDNHPVGSSHFMQGRATVSNLVICKQSGSKQPNSGALGELPHWMVSLRVKLHWLISEGIKIAEIYVVLICGGSRIPCESGMLI